ncbi:bifunctional adenosylcobinamide kinase/adenosylcobinamide-phosphate guanylyltransferase [Tepidibacter hydrothermalis]|uniref:Adenosylcobinamide kinase n=1 Tax=Tepidibacter hydrothermalis TaxID=3036126 RepID=A0ABY8ECN7_9FIRM|nr:bifunctional adenosylcobinamide kinase/adenosylcobinamide-phosphate guanylyltransferase [Tepidibacter hydrothermalis]WFD09554.1 bifunctional adenosylcobinamide kinase/adenosylcobinamide-phosphate guanylyltransferase [Tepidibacter hydrothermalis]
MSQIVMVTGGARSGKSSFSEELCKCKSEKVAYIATSIAFDDGMRDRIKKHKESRPQHWNTYETYKDIYNIIDDIKSKNDTVLLDCVTLLVNNLMFEFDVDWDEICREEIDKIESYINEQVVKLIDAIRNTELYFVFVTNELGMGIVPENRLSRIYRDIAGRVNQKIATLSDEVYLVVSSIPVKIKG